GPVRASRLPPYDEVALPDRSYSAAEVDEALAALVEPGRLAHAQDVVVHAAPTLQRMLAEAMAEGGMFGGVAVGFELAHELALGREPSTAVHGDKVKDGQESSGRETGGREPQNNQPSTEEH